MTLRVQAAHAAILVATLLLGACSGTKPGAGQESVGGCNGPYLNTEPPGGSFPGPTATVSPGDALTIYGHGYTSTCNDTGESDERQPLPPVQLTVTLPGGKTTNLGTFAPQGGDMGFSTTLTVPAGTPSGIAKVSDDGEETATYRFEVR